MLPKHRFLVLLGLAALGTAVYAQFVEPYWIDVRHMTLKLPRLPQAFHGYRIVHISDFHLSSSRNAQILHDAVAMTRQIEPDLIAITGDFVQRMAHDIWDELDDILRPLQARDGVVAVLGNHDHRSDAYAVRQALQSSHIIELNNRVHTVQRGDAQLHLAGVDDIVFRRDLLDKVLDQLPETGAAILLAHEPDFADISAATGRFDLQLSGHSHGGQIRLPLIGAPVLPSYGKRYPDGQYQVGQMIQYTNRGLGTTWPHLRFNVRPELSVLHLEAPDI